MQIIHPYTQTLTPIDGNEILKKIERCGRVSYKSEDKINSNLEIPSSWNFVSKIIKNGHESVLEHESISVLFVVDRGVSHEIVRHRIAAYTQESTRYCNYSNDRFGGEITVIKPLFLMEETPAFNIWRRCCEKAEATYFELLDMGLIPQEARSVLPNSLKTEIVATYNLREWRHFFKLRTARAAHPQMREVTIPLLQSFKDQIPIVFDDIEIPGSLYNSFTVERCDIVNCVSTEEEIYDWRKGRIYLNKEEEN